MRKLITIASTLAIALAMPAMAQNNNGNDRGGGKAQSAQNGDKGGKRDRRESARPANSDNSSRADRDQKPTKARDRDRSERSNDQGNRSAERRADRRDDRRGNQGNRAIDTRSGDRRARDLRAIDRRGSDTRERSYERGDDRRERYEDSRFDFQDRDDRRRFTVRYDRDYRENRSARSWCPPGLRKKNNGCQPPGQAKKLYEDNDRWGRYYRTSYSRFGDGDWRYYDGYAYQSRGGLIDNLIPLVGGALFGGKSWPSAYNDYVAPQYFSDYYGRNDDYSYYYADRTLFTVDPEDRDILGIAALLTGDDINIGQPMPRGYDTYNVPYAYRDQYYDRPDAQYRYSDGYVYQIDPETRLVAAAIELIS